MRNAVILLAIPLWLSWGLLWLLPLKRKLLRLHGFDKTNSFIIDLARKGDPDAKTLYWRTKVFAVVGVVGGVAMVLSKYF